MDRKQEILKTIAEWPDEVNVTTAIRQLFDKYKVRRPTPQWLIEACYFELLRRDYRVPAGRIVFGDKPDLILQGTRKIGIEITNFFLENGALPESEQVQSRARKAVVREAQRIYLADGGKRIELSFSFDKARPIGDSNGLAKKMAELARRVEGSPTGEIWRKNFKGIPELSFVYLYATESDDAQWRVGQGYSGQLMSRDKLLDIVRKKESKSKDYRPCDAFWLVVVVECMDPAQDQEIQIDDFQKIHPTVFEKVIVYKPLFHHVLEAK